MHASFLPFLPFETLNKCLLLYFIPQPSPALSWSITISNYFHNVIYGLAIERMLLPWIGSVRELSVETEIARLPSSEMLVWRGFEHTLENICILKVLLLYVLVFCVIRSRFRLISTKQFSSFSLCPIPKCLIAHSYYFTSFNLSFAYFGKRVHSDCSLLHTAVDVPDKTLC
jgi:hypothetical protein